jgi:choline transport protein
LTDESIQKSLTDAGNTDDVLESPYPIIPICFNAAGRTGGTAMIVGLLIVTFCVIAASLASVSRITWAWARDGGLPTWFAQIHPRHRVPIRALWLPIIIVSVLSLFAIGNDATNTIFGAFTSLASLGLYSSYIIAICCMLHARFTGRIGDSPQAPLQYGEWRLPKGAGLPLNIYALLWTIYLTIWLPFPTTLPVTAFNMNYSGPIYIAVLLLSIVYWFVWGKSKWPGLNAEAIARVEAHD